MKISEMTILRKNITLVMISMMVGMMYYIPYIRFYFYDQAIEALQIANLQMGTIGAVYGFVALLLYPVSGILSTKFSAKILFTISFIGSTLCSFWYATYPSYVELLIIAALFAIFQTAFLWSPFLMLVRSLGEPKNVGKRFGFSEAMRGVGGTLIGFVFVYLFSLSSNAVGGFKTVLIAGGVLYGVCALLSFLFLPVQEKETKETATGSATVKSMSTMDAIKVCLKNKGVWQMSLLIFFGFSFYILYSNYLGTYTTQIIGVPPNISSVLSVVRNSLVPIVAGILGGIIIDKFKYKATFERIMGIVVAVLCILLPFIASAAYFAIIITIFIALFCQMVKATYFSIMDDAKIPLELTGIATGIICFLGFIPDFILTPIMGAWLDKDLNSGFNIILLTMAISGILFAVISMLIIRSAKKEVHLAKKSHNKAFSDN